MTGGLALATLLALVVTAAVPSQAHAWAWSDTCSLTPVNDSGGTVRPVVWLPIPPDVKGLAVFTAYLATGIPAGRGITISNTGYPVTWGCHDNMTFVNPGSNVSCGYDAPTKGANSFNCGGNARVRLTKDNDDIAADVSFQRSFAGSHRRSTGVGSPGANRLAQRRVLASRELPGSGWRRAPKLTDLGQLGALWAKGTTPRSCQSSRRASEASVTGVGTSSFGRRSGSETIGSVDAVYATSAQARSTLQDALSAHSVGCLAQLLRSGATGTAVSVKPLSFSGLGVAVSARRLVVTTGSGPTRAAYYLDVAAIHRGRHFGLFVFANATGPTSSATERGAVVSVNRRLT